MVESIKRYRPQGVAFSSWLYRIAHNLLVDRYRRAGRETVELSDEVRDLRPQADPADLLQNSEQRRALVEAVQRLTPEQQQVIAMRFIDNLDASEIARQDAPPARGPSTRCSTARWPACTGSSSSASRQRCAVRDPDPTPGRVPAGDGGEATTSGRLLRRATRRNATN